MRLTMIAIAHALIAGASDTLRTSRLHDRAAGTLRVRLLWRLQALAAVALFVGHKGTAGACEGTET